MAKTTKASKPVEKEITKPIVKPAVKPTKQASKAERNHGFGVSKK